MEKCAKTRKAIISLCEDQKVPTKKTSLEHSGNNETKAILVEIRLPVMPQIEIKTIFIDDTIFIRRYITELPWFIWCSSIKIFDHIKTLNFSLKIKNQVTNCFEPIEIASKCVSVSVFWKTMWRNGCCEPNWMKSTF